MFIETQLRYSVCNSLGRPRIVCLCGSARFGEQFQESYLEETLAGHIVLSIAAVSGGDEALFARLSPDEQVSLQNKLAELHRHKIDLADEVLILNVGGYIGPSTADERDYAERQGKRIRYLE